MWGSVFFWGRSPVRVLVRSLAISYNIISGQLLACFNVNGCAGLLSLFTSVVVEAFGRQKCRVGCCVLLLKNPLINKNCKGVV